METRSKTDETELNTMLDTVGRLQTYKAKLELELADIQAQINDYCTTVIPEYVDDTGGASKGFLSDGTEWAVEKKYRVSQPKATLPAFHEWLDANGFKNLIKRKATVDLGKLSLEEYNDFRTKAKEAGYDIEQVTTVAPATCKKWVVDRIKAGLTIPDDLLSVTTWHQVKFKTEK